MSNFRRNSTAPGAKFRAHALPLQSRDRIPVELELPGNVSDGRLGFGRNSGSASAPNRRQRVFPDLPTRLSEDPFNLSDYSKPSVYGGMKWFS